MASPHNSPRTKGFTLIEIMLVVGLVAFVGGISIYYGIDAYRGQAFHSDRDVLVAALQHARAQSVSNMCLGVGCSAGKPHGVAIVSGQIVVFQGSSYATRDSAVDAPISVNPNTSFSGGTEIVFTQISATTTGTTVTVSEPSGRASSVTIGTEGEIVWTN